MPALTLLVPVRDPGSELDALVTSIDAQTAPRDTFDVVFVDGGSTDGTPERLRRLAAARPNVVHLAAAADLDDAGLVRAGLENAAGDLVAVVRPGERLTGPAVSLLVAAAADGADAVVGRGSSVPAGDGQPLVDGPVGAGPQSGRADLVAVRRAALADAADPVAALLDPSHLADRQVVAVGSMACLGRPWPEGGPVVEGRLGWDGTRLDVEVALEPAQTAQHAWLLLARADGADEVALPAEVADAADGRARVTASVDLAPGGPLADGVWHLRLRVRGTGGPAGTDRTAAVTDTAPAAAVLRGRQVVPASTPGGLTLDLGATASSLVGRVPPAHATLAETARGAQLVLRVPKVHVVGDARTPVAVLLGRFRLPAVLVCADGSAHVEAWVSGLAGRSRISVQTGGDKPRRTGLDLRIAGSGEMSLGRTPRPVTPPTPAAPPVGVRGLRRRVPDALEPVARRLARVGPLRAVYRRVASR